MNCYGKQHEGPTLVFDSGYGVTLDNWNPIKDEISNFSKMFIYDRAGIGKLKIGRNDNCPCGTDKKFYQPH